MILDTRNRLSVGAIDALVGARQMTVRESKALVGHLVRLDPLQRFFSPLAASLLNYIAPLRPVVASCLRRKILAAMGLSEPHDPVGQAGADRRRLLAAAGAAAVTVAANRAPIAPKPPTSPRKPAPFAPTKNVPESRVSARVPLEVIALSRLTYGPTPAELTEFRAGGKSARACLERFVEAQLHPESLKDDACDAHLAGLKLTTLGKSLPQLWQDHVVAANKIKEDLKEREQKSTTKPAPGARPDEADLRQQPLRETEIATWVRAIYSRRQLGEVIVDFWHNHFSVFGPEGQIAPTFVHFDRDVIRKHALGNFRAFLEEVASSPTMLFYLDNNVNQSGNPNENYARELFELHALGAENYLGTVDRAKVPGYGTGASLGYVDGDVYEAARCFTGWRVDAGSKGEGTGGFQYFDLWHDRFQKIILGHAIPEHQAPMQDGRDVLDLLGRHPGTAHFIARKLCIRLVGDEPSNQLVSAVAKVFRDTQKDKDQLRSVIRAIALSDEFSRTWGGKLRRPFELMVAALRISGADCVPSEEFLRETGRCGQRLFQWRTPDGYPDHRQKWGGTSGMLERWRFCNQLVNGKIPGTNIDVVKQTPAHCRSPAQLADFWLMRLLNRQPQPATRRALVAFLSQGRNPTAPLLDDQRQERLTNAVALAMMTPEFQWR